MDTVDRFRQQLEWQLLFLRNSCAAYDEGHLSEGIRIATVIRTLLKSTKRCTSLLEHLGNPSILLASMVAEPDPQGGEIIAYDGLCCIEHHAERIEEARVRPNTWVSAIASFIPAEVWWKEQVVYVANNHRFTREGIVGAAADTDGGAHVDSSSPPGYSMLRDKSWNEIMLATVANGPKYPPMFDVHVALLRTMGFELLNSPQLTDIVGRPGSALRKLGPELTQLMSEGILQVRSSDNVRDVYEARCSVDNIVTCVAVSERGVNVWMEHDEQSMPIDRITTQSQAAALLRDMQLPVKDEPGGVAT